MICSRSGKSNPRPNFSFPCPFPDLGACIDSQNNVQYDTGYIHSSKDLGINAPPEDSVFYRKTTTCAVVDSTKWLSGFNSSSCASNFVEGSADVLPGDTSIYYYFGPVYSYNGSETVQDYTFSVSNYSRYSATNPYTVMLVMFSVKFLSAANW